MGNSKRVVVTGAQGDISKAVLRRLRDKSFKIVALERGDDMVEHVRKADAVVVLDDTSPGGSDYRLGLEAVAYALGRTGVRPVVSVWLEPITSKGRQDKRDRARAAEEEFRTAGYPLTAVDAGLIIGSPGQPAPADSALFGRSKANFMPGNGRQQIRPLLIDDLTDVVATVLESRLNTDRPLAEGRDSPSAGAPGEAGARNEGPHLVTVEGPDEFTLTRLLMCLNPQAWRPRRQGLLRAARPIALFAPALLMVSLLAGWDANLHVVTAVVIALASAVVTLMFSLGVLPDEDLKLGPDPPKHQVEGITLRKITDVWDETALRNRRRRPGLTRSARRYAAAPGSYWVGSFLVGFGMAAAIVGVHDMVTARGLGAQLTSGALAVAGAVAAFGGAALWSRWRLRYALAFLGSVVCTSALTTISISALLSESPPPWMYLVPLYLVGASISCCIRLWKRGGLVVKDIMATRGQKLLGSLVVGGTVAALIQATYSSIYVPATATPALSEDVTFARDGEIYVDRLQDSRLALNATIKLRNPSNYTATILGAVYLVDAHQLGTDASRSVYAKDSKLIAQGPSLPPGTSLASGEEATQRIVVSPPVGYSLASLRVDTAIARHNLGRQKVLGSNIPDRGVSHSLALVEDDSWLHLLTQAPRYVHVLRARRDELGCSPRTVMVAYIDARKTTSRPRWCAERSRLDEHYGVTHKQVRVEVALPRLGNREVVP